MTYITDKNYLLKQIVMKLQLRFCYSLILVEYWKENTAQNKIENTHILSE